MGWKRESKRGRYTWLQHFECSGLALLRTLKALWKLAINKRGEGKKIPRESFCSVSPASVTFVFSCCSMLWFACEEQSWVSRRFRFLLPSSSIRHKSRPTTLCPPFPFSLYSLLTQFWFLAGPREKAYIPQPSFTLDEAMWLSSERRMTWKYKSSIEFWGRQFKGSWGWWGVSPFCPPAGSSSL